MKFNRPQLALFLLIAIAMLIPWICVAEERHQAFDRDPQWDGHNNRATKPEPQPVRQDFGHSATKHAGGTTVGEIGGFITPAAEPAYYARRIPKATFQDRLIASGKLACTDRNFHVLVGFFNGDTINEWRTPNSIVFRLYGRGDVFYAYVEYATSRWRGRRQPGRVCIDRGSRAAGAKTVRRICLEGDRAHVVA